MPTITMSANEAVSIIEGLEFESSTKRGIYLIFHYVSFWPQIYVDGPYRY